MRTRCLLAVAALAAGPSFVFADAASDFDAAVKAGKPLSAEAAYRKLMKAGGTAQAMRHLAAAEVAEQLGKPTLANDRRMLYVRLEKAWKPEVEQILWSACSTGTDVELFSRLAGNSQPTDLLWSVGRGMFGRIYDQNRPNELIKLADALLAKFPNNEKRANDLLQRIYENARNCGPTYPKDELAHLVARHPGLAATDGFYNLITYGNQRDAFPRGFVLRYVAKHGAPVRDDILRDSISTLDQNNIHDLKDADKVRERDAIVAAVKKCEAVIFDGKHPQSALKYFRVVGLRLPGSFLAGVKADSPVAPGIMGIYRKLTAFPQFKDDAFYRRDVVGQCNEIINWKRFTEAEAKQIKDEMAKLPQQNPKCADVIKALRETKDNNVRLAKLKELLALADRNFVEWSWCDWACNQIKTPESWYLYRKRQVELNAKGSHDAFSWSVYVAKDSEAPFAGVDLKKMSEARCREYFQYNYGNLKAGEKKDQFLLDAAFSRPWGEWSWDNARYFAQLLCDRAADPKFLAKIPVDAWEKDVFAEKKIAFHGDVYIYLIRVMRRLAAVDQHLDRYFAWADGLSARNKAWAYSRALCDQVSLPKADGSGSEWRWVVENPRFAKGLTGFTSAIKGVAKVQSGALAISYGNSFWDRLRNFRNECAKDNKDPQGVAAVEAFYDAVVEKVLAGARNDDGLGMEAIAWHRQLNGALKAKSMTGLATYARRAGASLSYSSWVGYDWAKSLMGELKESGNDEAFYLYVDAVPSDAYGDLVSTAAKYRAEVASKLPGIYPVGENDPMYPLYVAADELARKNSERAWQILQEPKNQTVFEREALKFPPDFVIWAVEQLRMARGDKDALLIKARQIATAILAQESKTSPEVAAAMILSRAEGYRDQQNFEAAKLEYQSVRENPTYHATKYGKQAMFRAVDLQIASGNYQGVESTLEYWLSQNDREIQAQAHYFMAKIAFDRKDYDETIKQLRQVFAIDLTHTEGRFLEGKWKLATNSEVDETEVPVGDLTDRSMIRPGNQLTVTVQDKNLSVAGGGASIPVIVTTVPGGDTEYVSLYPTSRDPSNFKGLVEVQLGRACPSNRVLEVRGDDTVSYVIDPKFLQERGLPQNEPKKLHVIDDGKLAIGAGAPRTDEKKTEKGVKDLLSDDSNLEDSGVVKKLRPGNPLYVVVQDGDCSLGGTTDSVKVTVETSSGDRLEDYELVEEKPFSGVFRGKIETSLPPPRAFASDSAAGMNPGDVINSNKKAGWKSLADGQPGKWFSVDTMGSYLFNEITLETPSVNDVKRIKLVGRMGSKVMTLGQLPEATEMSKLYLRRQQQSDRRAPRSLGQLRAYCQTDKAAKPYIVDKLQFRALQKGNNNDTQSALYRGPFVVPDGVDSLRLRIVPISSKKDALRYLWVALALDGEEVFSGQGVKLQNALMAADITPGCHQFELAVVAVNHEDDFDLMWEPVGKDPQQLPGDWFNEEKHPVLKRFVKDQATIVKTANGYKASFTKPVRLRSFTWEFADVKSPDVSITRIAAKNDLGEDILPVGSDFSDSLNNKTLEVAPGDKITVRYEDERTTSGEKKVLQRDMSSSFNDAKVRFIFEETDERGNVQAYDAFRFQPGDSLVLAVEDPDCDISDEADKIEVSIKNSKGEEFKKRLVEYLPKWSANGRQEGTYGMHSGIFMGVLKTCHDGDTNAPPKVLRVRSDDQLTVTYEDRENTDPGVPCARTVRIFAARPSEPQLTLFHSRKTQEVDKSADAKVKLERIRRRPGNENVNVVYRDVFTAEPMSREECDTTNAIPVNVAASIPVRVNDRSRARYACSKVMIEAVAHSEIEKASAEGRDPDKVSIPLKLGGSLSPFKLMKGAESDKEAKNAGTFNGLIQLSLGPIDPNIEVPEDAPPVLCVTGSDMIDITVLSEEGQPVLKRTLKLVSDATMGLTDSSFSAERISAHVGESFFVMVDDADRDATEDPDKIEAEAISSKTGVRRPIVLTETMPHSGIFTGRLRPVMFAPGEVIPNVATGGVASANEVLTEERFAVSYGDQVIFRYKDDQTLPGTPARTLATTGTVFRGANGDVRMFSKRFSDRDTAVLVQFRLAECLFEQAKEHRKLKQPEKSAACIDEGKFILEEALKNYPDSSHVVQGEFLLANLYQELATEAKDAEDMEKATPLYQEALSRFSQILGTWPEGEYAARSQYHKALCLEMLKDYNRASEEYVKMTYLYPESELVGEATIRLATYYYTKEKRFDISGHIYANFQQRFPQHEKAARALFMAGSCYIKQAETIGEDIEKRKAEKQPIPQGYQQKIDDFYRDAVKTFDTLVETYRDNAAAKLKAQTLYWAGDVCVRRHDYTKAYQYLKRTVFEFPETEWARRARGLLLQEGKNFKEFE